MSMQLLPTRAGMRAMEGLGLSWGDVLNLLETCEQEQPCAGGSNRRSHLCSDYILFTARGTFEGEPALNLLGISRRNRDEQVIRKVVEKRPQKQGKKGGAGTLVPTSFDEILRAIDDADGWHYEMGGKHIAVYGPNGVRSTIPVSTSDWRAIKNNVSHLRKLGMDVRRRPGKKAS